MNLPRLKCLVIGTVILVAAAGAAVPASEEKRASETMPASADLRTLVSSLEDDFLAQLAASKDHARMFDAYEAKIKNQIAQNPGRPEPYFGLSEPWEKCGNDHALQLIAGFLAKPDLPETVRACYGQINSVLEPAGTKIDVSLETLTGRKINWEDYRGKVVLIDFWATWCGPCVQELPKVKGYYSELHPQGPEIVGVSFDDDHSKLENFIRARELPWTQVHALGAQRETVAQSLGVTRGYLPTVFLIGRDGRIRYSFNSRFEMKEKIMALLREGPSR